MNMSFDIFGNSGRRKGTIRKERGFFGDTSQEIIMEEKNQQQERKQDFLAIQVM